MQRVVRIFFVLLGAFFIYRYRYRMMNRLLSFSWLRSIAVKTAFRVPAVRNKMMNQVFK